jgi:hypothetical protein
LHDIKFVIVSKFERLNCIIPLTAEYFLNDGCAENEQVHGSAILIVSFPDEYTLIVAHDGNFRISNSMLASDKTESEKPTLINQTPAVSFFKILAEVKSEEGLQTVISPVKNDEISGIVLFSETGETQPAKAKRQKTKRVLLINVFFKGFLSIERALVFP